MQEVLDLSTVKHSKTVIEGTPPPRGGFLEGQGRKGADMCALVVFGCDGGEDLLMGMIKGHYSYSLHWTKDPLLLTRKAPGTLG